LLFRVDESRWSDPFTLVILLFLKFSFDFLNNLFALFKDTIEDAGKVTCKRASTGNSQRGDPLSLGVNINMSKSRFDF